MWTICPEISCIPPLSFDNLVDYCCELGVPCDCSHSHLFFSVAESWEECKTLAFPGRRLQELLHVPFVPGQLEFLIPCLSRLRSTRYSDLVGDGFTSCIPCSGPALLTNGNALMCHSVALLPNFTHFLRDSRRGRQSLVGVCFA